MQSPQMTVKIFIAIRPFIEKSNVLYHCDYVTNKQSHFYHLATTLSPMHWKCIV